jgi:hypothetical protein
MQRKQPPKKKDNKKRKPFDVDVDVEVEARDADQSGVEAIGAEEGDVIVAAAHDGGIRVIAEVAVDVDDIGRQRHQRAKSVRCIISAAVDESGQVLYSYGRKKRPQASKKTQEGDEHDSFADLFCLTYTRMGGLTDMKWINVATGAEQTSVKYFKGVSNYNLDIEYLRIAVSWLCGTKYRVDVWDLESNEIVAVFKEFDGLRSVKICGDRLLTFTDNDFSAWEISTQTAVVIDRLTNPKHNEQSEDARVTPASIYDLCCVYPPDSSPRFVVVLEGSIVVFDGNDGSELMSVQWGGNFESGLKVVVSPDKSAYIVTSERVIYVRESVLLTQIASFSCSSEGATAVGFGSVNEIIFNTLYGRGLLIWNYRTNEVRTILVRGNGRPMEFNLCIVFNSRTNKIIAFNEETKKGYAIDAATTSTSLNLSLTSGKSFPPHCRRIYHHPAAAEVVLM